MTKENFPLLPNELVVQVAHYANDSSLLSLLLCCNALHTLLKPILHTRAIAPRGTNTAIQWAANQGQLSLVQVCPHPGLPNRSLTPQFLLSRGIHPDSGATPNEPPALQQAVDQGHVDIVELLATHGADDNHHNYTGYGTNEAAIRVAASSGDAGMITLLAAHGADVGCENIMGCYVGTALHMAVWGTHVAAVRELLALQVPVDGKNSGRCTALDLAAMVATDDADTEELWASMVEIGKMLV